jgi:hypothetical protein
MRVSPETGPLLLPTVIDVVVPSVCRLFASVFQLAFLILIMVFAAWIINPRTVPNHVHHEQRRLLLPQDDEQHSRSPRLLLE